MVYTGIKVVCTSGNPLEPYAKFKFEVRKYQSIEHLMIGSKAKGKLIKSFASEASARRFLEKNRNQIVKKPNKIK